MKKISTMTVSDLYSLLAEYPDDVRFFDKLAPADIETLIADLSNAARAQTRTDAAHASGRRVQEHA